MNKGITINKNNYLSNFEENLSPTSFDIFNTELNKQTNEEIFLEWKEKKWQGLLFMLLYKNRKFLFNEIRKFQFMYNSVLDEEDLLSIASIGFIKGCEHFDSSKEVKLLTYVAYWIHSELSKEIKKNAYAVKIPAHIWCDFMKLNKSLKRNGNVTLDHILLETGFSLQQYNQLMEISQNCLNVEYLDSKEEDLKEELLLNNNEQINKIGIDNLSEAEEYADKVLLVSNVTKAMSVLSDKEKDILVKRLYIENKDKMTLREIAEKYGVSSQRINEIEKRALNKLRNTPILNDYSNIKSSLNEYKEEYLFKKNGVSYIPSTQEIINRIVSLQNGEYDAIKLYKEYLICAKSNGYKDFITSKEFREKLSVRQK